MTGTSEHVKKRIHSISDAAFEWNIIINVGEKEFDLDFISNVLFSTLRFKENMKTTNMHRRSSCVKL